MTNKIILTVQPCGKVVEKCEGKYRLGVNSNDSTSIFKMRHFKIYIEIDGEVIETKTTCGPPNKKGFDIYNIKLNNWIKDQSFCNYERGKPTKLSFQIIELIENKHIKIKFNSKI